MNKKRLKPWVKKTIAFLLGILVGIILYQLVTLEKSYTTPVGDYYCRGGILKVCVGSQKVANYLGVE